MYHPMRASHRIGSNKTNMKSKSNSEYANSPPATTTTTTTTATITTTKKTTTIDDDDDDDDDDRRCRRRQQQRVHGFPSGLLCYRQPRRPKPESSWQAGK
ncbi:unnamed protein product [Polarella glacialis]|uniref:Uncharacterized protein n=1 Tax=Polarella glacialis TaxID=89957 RepID=A0A813F2T1_POLGL|nr:unnamed protein product [Polarella glacialis]